MKGFSLKFHLISYVTLLTIGTVIFRTTDLDLLISDRWYFSEESWISVEHPFWGFVYKYFTGPNLITLYIALITLIYAAFISKHPRVKWSATCVVIAIIIGPGILVNGILKPLMGRPRPYIIERYQGAEKFVPVLTPSNLGKSFPSGHAASGFVLTILFFVFYKKRKKLAWVCWFFGIGFGVLLSIGRIAQGGHFASDVFWAFGITQLVNCMAYFKLQPLIEGSSTCPSRTFFRATLREQLIATTGSLLITILFLFGYLINFPFTFHQNHNSTIPSHINKVVIHADLENERIKLFERDSRSIGIDHLAFANGFPWSGVTSHTSVSTVEKTLIYTIRITETGLFRDYRGRIKIFLPKSLEIDFGRMKGTVVEDSRKK